MYYTLAEAARIANVTRQRIHTLQRKGVLGTVRLTPLGRPYVPEISLRQWLRARDAHKESRP